MMPILGEPLRFAVEYELNADYGGQWMFGRLCYWCTGCRIGDYGTGTSLRDILFRLDPEARKRGPRANKRFDAMPPLDLFRTLDAALFGEDSEDHLVELSESENWSQHNILPSVDIFDHWKGFLVENDITARLIVARSPYLYVKEFAIKSGEMDAVLEATWKSLDNIHEREIVKV